jgi:hypothetical protein
MKIEFNFAKLRNQTLYQFVINYEIDLSIDFNTNQMKTLEHMT